MYNLQNDGDVFEQKAYPLFIKNKFPSYEAFWQKFIIPLTNRPDNIYTKSDVDLQIQFPGENLEKIHERVVVLQLHYSVFRMLLKVYEKSRLAGKDIDAVEGCFSHMYSALDISAELFGRYERIKNNLPISTSAFDSASSVINSLSIRRSWQRSHAYPKKINDIRNYRNLMLHGQTFGSLITPAANLLILPKTDTINHYLDWREIGKSYHSKNINDFLHSVNIVDSAIDEVVRFLEAEWKNNLL